MSKDVKDTNGNATTGSSKPETTAKSRVVATTKKSRKFLMLVVLAIIAAWMLFINASDNDEEIENNKQPRQAALINEEMIAVEMAELEKPKTPSSSSWLAKDLAAISQQQQLQQQIEREQQKIILQRQHAPITSLSRQSQKSVSNDIVKESNTNDSRTAIAVKLGALTHMILQGKLIPAVLETAINSQLPGMVRAIVDKDIYAEHGKKILVPKGTRLIGKYSSEVVAAQNRVLVSWERLIRPDGIAVKLSSSAVDALGNTGVAGKVNTHFWARFGEAILLSVIGAGAANLEVSPSDEANSIATYRSAVADSFATTAAESINNRSNVKPTIEVAPGSNIQVLVAQDLDFKNVL